MAWVLGHRQTKGAETDIPPLQPPRHTSTLPDCARRAIIAERGHNLTYHTSAHFP